MSKRLWKLLMMTWLVATSCLPGAALENATAPAGKKVYIIPIREDIMPPLVYLVRRGVKAAMENNADLLILDMETNGGRVDVTEEIIKILDQFKGQTVTYVNRNAFSAGAFISVATQKIYMAPQSVIGAAAPIMLSPEGGVQKMPDTMEAKTVSAISAMVRARAEKNGHNVEVVQAMIDKTKELKIDGKILNKEGQILTLTDKEAAQQYGQPAKPLLSAGTVDTLEDLLLVLNYKGAEKTEIKATGAEKLGFWINAISPILLIIGIVGIYIEFKTPGFGLPGIVGIIAFAVYFLGGYVAGLSGLEWVALFFVGIVLLALELFVFPGTVVVGVAGVVLMLAAIVMALADVYPNPSLPGTMPRMPQMMNLQNSLQNLAIALGGTGLVIAVLSRLLPKTALYRSMVSQTASGVESVIQQTEIQASRVGQVGTAISNLRPGGKAQFGNDILDVMSQGELIPKDSKVKIISHSGMDAIVEMIE